MKARELFGAATLGLLASLLAHAAGYGTGHAMGGSYHETLLAAAGCATLAGAIALLGFAWAATGRTLDGSLVAARLRTALPSWHAVVLSATAWLTIAENIEPHHDAASPLLLAFALAAAAWLVLRCAERIVAFFAAIVIAVWRAHFASRRQICAFFPRERAPRRRNRIASHRLTVRPPPVVAAGA